MSLADRLRPRPLKPPAPASSPKPPKVERPTYAHVDGMTKEHGWFQKQLWMLDSMLWKRWAYWIAISLNHSVRDRKEFAIPQIPFTTTGNASHVFEGLPDSARAMIGTPSEAVAHVLKVFEHCRRYTMDLTSIVRWWLYAFGDPTVNERPQLPEDVAVIQYHELQLHRMMANPTDWGAIVCAEWLNGGKKGTGWFPTPVHLADMMTRMTFEPAVDEGRDTRLMTVSEPCVGTGVFLLCASNYSLRITANDIDPLMIAWTRFASWLFVPWAVWPAYVKEFNEKEVRNEQGTSKRKTATKKK